MTMPMTGLRGGERLNNDDSRLFTSDFGQCTGEGVADFSC